MSNNYFQFKQFIIRQDRCAMKVGTDGVLLGAWVNVEGAKKILDVGTGTGLIALMLAQRSKALIDALEIDNTASKQAAENVKESRWNDRINVICDSFQNFSKVGNQYDLIVCNPPYFSKSMQAPDAARNLARHNNNLLFGELVEGVRNLLTPVGRFCIIWPWSDYNNVKKISSAAGLFESLLMNIIPAPGKTIERVMVEFSYIEKKSEFASLIVEELGRHKYSDEYKQLTKEFYLKF